MHLCVRFRGELFGLGNNHTKYKPKGGAGGANHNGNQQSAAAPQLQYSNTVHYPHAPQLSMNQISASNGSNGNFGYDEGY